MRLLRPAVLIFLGLGGWVLAGLSALMLYNILYKPWDDSISLANRHTIELLALHERDDQTRQVQDWLIAYHGEAPSHQVMISFAEWAMDHQAEAERLLSGEINNSQLIAERLAFAATDSGNACKFRTTFADSSVPMVVAVLQSIKQLGGTQGCG